MHATILVVQLWHNDSPLHPACLSKKVSGKRVDVRDDAWNLLLRLKGSDALVGSRGGKEAFDEIRVHATLTDAVSHCGFFFDAAGMIASRVIGGYWAFEKSGKSETIHVNRAMRCHFSSVRGAHLPFRVFFP